MIFKWLRNRRVSRLLDKGLAHVRAGESDAALVVGKKLLAMKFSGGYEVVALAHEQRGELQPAIDILEEGVAKAPSVWRLWQLLGNLRDDSGDHERALDAYGHGLACSTSDKGSLHFNRAVTLGRMERFDESLAALEQVKQERLGFELKRACVQQGVHCLVASGRGTEAVAHAKRTIEELREQEHPAFLTELAWAHWRGEADEAATRKLLGEVLQGGVIDERALLLMRTLDGRPLTEGFEFELMVRGRSSLPFQGGSRGAFKDGTPAGYFRTVVVASADPEAGLRCAAMLEPPEERATLRIEESTLRGPVPSGTLEGVYGYLGRVYFPGEQGE